MPGDNVLLDVGCRKDMYCSDMTRTFFFEKVSSAHREIYEIVRRANERAIDGCKPGMLLKDVDALARDYITKKGYGDYFTHRLGHFIGLDVHEAGDVSASNDAVVKPGMIFSVYLSSEKRGTVELPSRTRVCEVFSRNFRGTERGTGCEAHERNQTDGVCAVAHPVARLPRLFQNVEPRKPNKDNGFRDPVAR